MSGFVGRGGRALSALGLSGALLMGGLAFGGVAHAEAPVVCVGDLAPAGQEEVDSFDSDFGEGGCTVLDGSLRIPTTNVGDLDGLFSLTSVTGDVLLTRGEFSTGDAVLTDLDGLTNLTSIGGNLDVIGNAELADLDGLSNLTSIGGNLNVQDNPELADLDGLTNLTSIGGNLNVQDNPELTDLDRLSNLTSIGGNLNVIGNAELADLDGLSNLTSIGGGGLIEVENWIQVESRIQVENNAILASFCGLYGLLSADGLVDEYIVSGNAENPSEAAVLTCDPREMVSTKIGLLLGDPGVSEKAKDKLVKAQDKLDKAIDKFADKDVKKGFSELAKTVKELSKAGREDAAVAGLIQSLVDNAADEAWYAIDTAIAAGGDQREIDKAEAELVKSEKDLDEGKPDKAIKHYGHAWDKAQKALK